MQIHVYEGADHAFFNDTRPEVYDQAAAKTAWSPHDRLPARPTWDEPPARPRTRGRGRPVHRARPRTGPPRGRSGRRLLRAARARGPHVRRVRQGTRPARLRGARPDGGSRHRCATRRSEPRPRCSKRLRTRKCSDPSRRRWLRAQVVGLLTTARRLSGEDISYADEVESCYGVRPRPIEWDQVAEAHKRLEAAVPGSGPLDERLIAWREAHAVAPEKLLGAISSLAEDLKERTERLFGLPDGEICEFELVTDKPWSGFNTYLGDLRSRVDVNTDLPVLSLSLATSRRARVVSRSPHRAHREGSRARTPPALARRDDLPSRYSPMPVGRGSGRSRACAS